MATNRPSPPDDLQNEGLLEWGRICDELSDAGLLNKADRAIIKLYCDAWQTYTAAQAAVNVSGPVVKYPNGMPGPSPLFNVAEKTAARMEKLLAQLGLTPAARHRLAPKDADQLELQF